MKDHRESRDLVLRPSGAGLRMRRVQSSEKGEVLLRGVGTLRYVFPPNASVQWQPDGLTIHTKKWFLGARLLRARFCTDQGPDTPSGGRIYSKRCFLFYLVGISFYGEGFPSLVMDFLL